MAFTTLDLASRTLSTSVLHVGTDTYSDEKLHKAILAACQQFINLTGCYQITETWTIAIGTGTAAATNAGVGLSEPWSEEMFISGYVSNSSGFKKLRLVSMSEWMNLMEGSATAVASTNVSHICFPTNLTVNTWPANSDALTLVINRHGGFTFTIADDAGNASPGSVSLPIPEMWVNSVIQFGAKMYLLQGADGHPDALAAREDWNRTLAAAKATFIDGKPGTEDQSVKAGRAGE
jgi:hypothetical protein